MSKFVSSPFKGEGKIKVIVLSQHHLRIQEEQEFKGVRPLYILEKLPMRVGLHYATDILI